jgi:hypothetical protein
MRRVADWADLGFSETLTDFAALNARSKFWGDDQRAAFLNWDALSDMRNRLDGRQGVNERIMLRELLRRTDMMVLYENKLDGFVRLHSPWVPGKIGHANQPRGGMHNITLESFYGPNAGLTEALWTPHMIRSLPFRQIAAATSPCRALCRSAYPRRGFPSRSFSEPSLARRT